MKIRTILLLIVLVAAAAGFAWRHRAVVDLRLENQALHTESLDAERLQRENASIGNLREQNQEVARLRQSTRHLHTLRNEVRQLTEQTRSLPDLRSENELLKAAAAGVASTMPAPADSALAARTHSISHANPAGFDSPESTLQTFLWASREGDLAVLERCLSPRAQEQMRARHAGLDDAQIREIMSGSRIGTWRVVSQQSTGPGQLRLYVQFTLAHAAEVETFTLFFRQIANQWLVDELP